MKLCITPVLAGALCLLLPVLLPGRLQAWGNPGHKAVCEVAYHELSSPIRSAVDAILATEPDPAFRAFSDACTWADRSGDVQRSNRPSHYINVPRNAARVERSACGASGACLLTAIPRDLEVLRAADSTPTARLMALKFLGHWVGDLHQPLHVSFSDDKGGNLIAVRSRIGCGTALHGVWDRCIPAFAMSRIGVDEDGAKFGRLLQQEISATERQAWTVGLRIEAWAGESLSIAVRPEVKYCTHHGGDCWYAVDSEEFRGASGLFDRLLASIGTLFAPASDERAAFRPRLWDGKRVVDITTRYAARFEPVVRERIKMAGVRLAALLKQALGGEAAR